MRKRDSSTSRRLPILAIYAGMIAALLSCGGEEGKRGGSQDVKDRLDRLRSLPYTTVTDDEATAGLSGVVTYDRTQAWKGYNLYFGHIETTAELLDMEGNVVHRWTAVQAGERGYMHGVLLENGDLLTFVEDLEVVRLDWNSRLLWRKMLPAHHEVCPLPDGSFYVIGRYMETHRGLPVKFPVIIRLDADGKELERWSTYEHLDSIKRALDSRSFLDTILDRLEAVGEASAAAESLAARHLVHKQMNIDVYDYLHMNAISVIPGNQAGRADSRFAAGNLLICFRNVNQIAVLEKGTWEILWAWGEGVIQWPHHPTMLESGNILLFDNGVEREHSRVIEVNPLTGGIQWEYTGNPPASFYSYTRGSAQRLPNGNTLVCDSNAGKAFEVSPEGETVWEWYNPNLSEGHRVQVYRMIRYSSDMVEPLLRRGRRPDAGGITDAK